MAKGKTENNRREATDPPKLRTLRSRKRGYPVENITEDQQDTAGVNKEDGTSLQCLQSPLQEGELKCTQPLESSSIADQQEKNGESDMPKVTTDDPKIQLVVCVTDCVDKANKNEMENEEKMPNKCEPSAFVNQPIDGSEEIKTTALEDDMCTEDSSDHTMEKNHEMDDVRQMSQEPVVAGSAKKRRRMGMCHLSEKERSQLLLNWANKAKSDEKHSGENTIEIVAEVLSSHLQATEIMPQIDINTESSQSNKDDREEPVFNPTAVDWTTVMCDPQSTEIQVSESDHKREPYPEVNTKHYPLEKKEPQSRAEPGSQMTVSVGAVCESDQNLCKSENLKDPDPDHPLCAENQGELTRAETEDQVTVSDNVSKKQKDPKQALNLYSEVEHQPNRSQTEVHVTADPSNVLDIVCEPQSQELQTNMGQIVGPPDRDKTAMLLSNMHTREQRIEQEPQGVSGATGNEIDACVDGHHSNGDNFYNNTNLTEVTPIEDKAIPLQLDSEAKTTVEKKENEALIQTSLSDTETDTTCGSVEMCNGHVTPKGSGGACCSGPNELRNKDASTVSMGPPQSWDFSDQSGLGGLDYVSDSQLNTIVMTQGVVDVENGVSLEYYEDGTELIHGLIRELSSLNRTVMATHRELENLRRKGRNSRNAIR